MHSGLDRRDEDPPGPAALAIASSSHRESYRANYIENVRSKERERIRERDLDRPTNRGGDENFHVSSALTAGRAQGLQWTLKVMSSMNEVTASRKQHRENESERQEEENNLRIGQSSVSRLLYVSTHQSGRFVVRLIDRDCVVAFCAYNYEIHVIFICTLFIFSFSSSVHVHNRTYKIELLFDIPGWQQRIGVSDHVL